MSYQYRSKLSKPQPPAKQNSSRKAPGPANLETLWAQGRLTEVGKACDFLLKKNRKHVPALGFKGALLFEQGNYPLAAKYFSAGLKLDHQNIFILKYKAKMHKAHEETEEELKCLDLVVRQEADVESLYRRGYLMELGGKFEEALESYDRALEVSPKERIILERRANMLELLGRHLELLDFYDGELVSFPGNAVLLRLKGRTLKKIGKFSEALECFNQLKDPTWNICYRGEVFQDLGKYIESLNCFNQVLDKDPNHLFAQVKQLRLYLETRDFMFFKEEMKKFKFRLEESIGDETHMPPENESLDAGLDTREKVALDILNKCEEIVEKLDAMDPNENVYKRIKHAEELDFLKENIDQMSLCMDENLEYSLDHFKEGVGKMQLDKSSNSITFQTKQILSVCDKDPGVERYKHGLVICFLRLFHSIKCASMSRFCEERGISEVEVEFVYLPWRTGPFSKKQVQSFFDWNNFRHFIDRVHSKYHNYFTDNLFNDMANLVIQINTNIEFRKHLKKQTSNQMVKKFKESGVKGQILEMYKNHVVGQFESDQDFLAFVHYEMIKEVLLKSSFPSRFDHMVKLRNILYYLANPSEICNRGGVIILRNPDDMGKDTEEIKMLLRKEVLVIKGMTYSAPKLQNTKALGRDVLEVVLDLFFWEPFKLTFLGFSSEHKCSFQIPAYNYNFMVNIRIMQPNFPLHRKVFFDCKSLHRKKTNFAKVMREDKRRDLRRKIYSSFTKKTADFGIYVI